MSFDVNAAARQLGVDPSKITASADGSTYTVTANGVTKTYKASGDGENSVFTEQAAQTSGSGTPALCARNLPWHLFLWDSRGMALLSRKNRRAAGLPAE